MNARKDNTNVNQGYLHNRTNIEDEDNYLSLEMFLKDFDDIYLVKGTLDNIWYVELVKGNSILWSSVITCDLDDRAEDDEWTNICTKKRWDKERMFGNEINIISKLELKRLLIEDGVKEEMSINLFTSIGLWKSLFLTLNYCTYILEKREKSYSNNVKDYIIKYNNRKETLERRKRNSMKEHGRKELINNIYNEIENLFSQLNQDNNNSGQIRISYKEPFYWPSIIPILYILEKVGKIKYMLLIIEYISEVKPELIFEFMNLSNENGDLMRLLNIMNNELLHNLSVCFQEYLSDLLSISKRSTIIMSSYITLKNKENKKIQENMGNFEKDEKCKNEESASFNEDNNLNVDNSKKKPNYMKPTRLSELRKQHSKKNNFTNEKKNLDTNIKKIEDEKNKTNSIEFTNNVEDKYKFELEAEHRNVIEYDKQFKNDMIEKQTVKNIVADNNNTDVKFKDLKNDENSSLNHLSDGIDEGELKNTNDRLEKIFNILEEKSKVRVEKIPDFDYELSNIIQEIDNIKMSGVNTTKDLSTNISDDYSQHMIDSTENKFIQEEKTDMNYFIPDRLPMNEEISKSPLDPYDWYYMSNNIQVNENKLIEVNNENSMEYEDNQNRSEENELKYIESILDKEIEELQRKENELVSNVFSD